METLLSVIIPVYNAAPYLPACLDGILPALVPASEILLIDDGSADESLRICQDYAARHDFIRVFTQHRTGPSAARNRGIDESRGRYLAFLDADDLIDTAAFRRVLELLPGSTADFWVSDFQRIAGNGCVLDRICQIKEGQPIASRDYLETFLSDNECVWNVWRYFFRRDYLLANGIRFIEGVDCAEDLEFVVHCLRTVRSPVFYHNPYYSYRVHYGNTLTRQYTLRRVRALMEMLRLSSEELQSVNEPFAVRLRDKLVREYLLNLTLCLEVPKADRSDAFRIAKTSAGLLTIPRNPKLRLIAAFVRLVGLPASARLLLLLKTLKRWRRKQKIKDFEKQCM